MTRERIAAARFILHEVLDGNVGLAAACCAHLLQDLLPGSLERVVLVDGDAVLVLYRRFFTGEISEQSTEQLELSARLSFSGFRRLRFDLREHLVDVVRLARELLKPLFPWLELRVVVTQTIDHLLQLDESPDTELIPVIIWRRAIQMIQRCFVVSPVVKDVSEVDACLSVV